MGSDKPIHISGSLPKLETKNKIAERRETQSQKYILKHLESGDWLNRPGAHEDKMDDDETVGGMTATETFGPGGDNQHYYPHLNDHGFGNDANEKYDKYMAD